MNPYAPRRREPHLTDRDRGIVARARASVLASVPRAGTRDPLFSGRVNLTIVNFPTSRQPAWLRVNRGHIPATVELRGDVARVHVDVAWFEIPAGAWLNLAAAADRNLPGCTAGLAHEGSAS